MLADRQVSGRRRQCLLAALGTLISTVGPNQANGIPPSPAGPPSSIDPALKTAWREQWEREILADARARYCDTQMGEEIGWLISPFLQGFYWGYLATGDTRWIDRLHDWTDAWIRRAVREPDGQLGWPKVGASGTDVDNLDSFNADSLLGEAMALRPIVLMSRTISRNPALTRYTAKARLHLDLARKTFEKWDARGVWRTTDQGIVTVELPYGIDPASGRWTEGEQLRNDPALGFSHQNNKANLVASWLMAMADATGEAIYRDRASGWWRVMKSRLHVTSDGSFAIWNYWQPAGPWDYRLLQVPKHWVGIHPNNGYYAIDVAAMVLAYEHGLIFNEEDIRGLVRTALATGRDWPALAPYDATLRGRFEKSLQPASWAGISLVPWYLARVAGGASP